MPDIPRTAPERAHALMHAARALYAHLERGTALATPLLRDAMHTAFGGTDAAGYWSWRDAYEASEAAVILFLQRFAKAMRRRATTPLDMIPLLERLAALEPSHTRRSDEQLAHQQFSTPLTLVYAALRAARLRTTDVMLEPSAGTGMLAVLPHTLGVPIHLNELGDTRFELLRLLFPHAHLSAHNAEHIRDFLPDLHPSVILMNPPFSRAAHVQTRALGIDLVHVASAYSTLQSGGRLVAITSHASAPDTDAWHHAFARITPAPRVVFTTTIEGALYQRRGTTFTSRLTVLDHTSETDTHRFPPNLHAATATDLITSVEAHVPPRRTTRPIALDLFNAPKPVRTPTKRRPSNRPAPLPAPDFGPVEELAYTAPEVTDATISPTHAGAGFLPWQPECIRIDNVASHPTALVQSAAMTAIRPPIPTARPTLPTAAITSGILSDAQLEQIVLASEAHSRHLNTEYVISEEWDEAEPVTSGTHPEAVRFRRGYMIGDGTGAGKGRQVAALLLDRWLRGRRRLVWLSFSATLINDAQRDWASLGGDPRQLIELSKVRQGDSIDHPEAILFATYATLRSPARGDKPSRLHQIITWLAGSLDPEDRAAYDGLIVFDESHALSHAIATHGSRGLNAPSQQGLAAMRLQHALPDARILYVSATGASAVEALSYASRLGLWGNQDSAFDTRSDFITSMNAGGVAAMELVSRDLKALGLYGSRILSYHGVEVEILEHTLTEAQREIYDAYADAFAIIHTNLEDALEISNITDEGATLNSQAKSAARSAFESTKQRFFSHLLNGMKCPTLLKSIQRDLDNGHAAVVQIVSTGEALLDRRIAEIPACEWDDLSVDLTPREYVLGYLENAFPTHLYETYADTDGHMRSRLVHDDNGMTRSSSPSSPRPAAPVAPITPISPARTSACAATTTPSPAGRPRKPSKDSAGPTAPTRPSPLSFSPSPPMYAASDDSSPPSPSASTLSAHSPAASATPSRPACSAPKTTSKAPTPTPHCASSSGPSTPTTSPSGRSTGSSPSPDYASPPPRATSRSSSLRCPNSSTDSSHCASTIRTRCSPSSKPASRPTSSRPRKRAPTISAWRPSPPTTSRSWNARSSTPTPRPTPTPSSSSSFAAIVFARAPPPTLSPPSSAPSAATKPPRFSPSTNAPDTPRSSFRPPATCEKTADSSTASRSSGRTASIT